MCVQLFSEVSFNIVLQPLFHSNPEERQCQRMFKLPHNCIHLTYQQSNAQNSLSQASTVLENFQMFKLDLKKAEGPQIKLSTSLGSSKKQENSRKTTTSASSTTLKPCVDHNTVKNSSRDGNTRPSDLTAEKSVCKSRSNSQNWTWNNGLVPNWERSTSRLYIVTLLI